MKAKADDGTIRGRRMVGRPRLGERDSGPGREELLEMIREAVREAGGRVAQERFLATRGLTPTDLFRHFKRWDESLLSAGCAQPAHNRRVDTTVLLEDWGRVALKVRRAPTIRDCMLHGHHTSGTYNGRFGSWRNLPRAFRAFAAGKPRWRQALKYVADSVGRKERIKAERAAAKRARVVKRRRPRRLKDRPMCGAQLGGEGPLRYAPTNEQGVVFLFGKMAEQLGFFVVGLQPYFPDCMAMREIAPGNWQPVRIEFEFESRSFRIHRHKPDGCDIIVCWEHNWKECPGNIEVIALKDEMGEFQI